MTIAYFDCFNGASGDMIVGALLAAGADLDWLREELAALPIEGIELRTRGLVRQGITATKFDVIVRGAIEAPAEEAHGHHHAHGHDQDHDHSHDHAHDHDHRTLGDVEAVLQHLPPRPRERAMAVFRRLAEAEAKVHGTTAPFVHFHEVGMDDAIVDVAAAVLCLEQLGVTEIHCSPLPLGSGMIRCAHGTMPVPVPAVVELMAGFPSYDNGETGELTTPTGAAILTALADRFGPPPPWSISAVGYGGGAREGQRVPNLLRVMIGQAAPAPTSELTEVQANLDDMNPQFFGPLVDRLLEAGALDVTLTPTIMKKGRPGIVLSALVPESRRAAVSETIFKETTTLGVRYHAVARTELQRETIRVETPWGAVSVKLGRLDGQVVNAMPEFEEVRRLAEAAGRPVKEVWQAAMGAAGGPW
ncbi:MAG: nickel pincer cofactor biosynthesis protein LarC [Candidatus Sericytochromatia bacterium]